MPLKRGLGPGGGPIKLKWPAKKNDVAGRQQVEQEEGGKGKEIRVKQKKKEPNL